MAEKRVFLVKKSFFGRICYCSHTKYRSERVDLLDKVAHKGHISIPIRERFDLRSILKEFADSRARARARVPAIF